MGVVSKADLKCAYSRKYIDHLAGWIRRDVDIDPRSLMAYVVDPWIVFEFSPFKKLFAEQFLPTAVDQFWKEDLSLYDGGLQCIWSTSFNPALLGFVTNGDFRFRSPLAMETDLDQVVLITPEMRKDDIGEVFASCLPAILSGGKPYLVKFTGYSLADPELWQIGRVVDQCQWIVEMSGCSVLDVFGPDDDEHLHDPLRSKGLNAFQIWLIARHQLESMMGVTIRRQDPLIQEFLSFLMESNAKLNDRLRTMPDCPIDWRAWDSQASKL